MLEILKGLWSMVVYLLISACVYSLIIIPMKKRQRCFLILSMTMWLFNRSVEYVMWDVAIVEGVVFIGAGAPGARGE